MKKLCFALGVVVVTAALIISASAQGRSEGVQFIDLGTFDNTGPFGFTISYDGGSERFSIENPDSAIED